jgi:hypothetical protein
MKTTTFIFIAVSLTFLCCCEDSNVLGLKRDQNVLEKKLVGAWGWALSTHYDTVSYYSDFSFKGKKDGSDYDGAYVLTLDSALSMKTTTYNKGGNSHDEFNYKMQRLDNTTLILGSVNASPITYIRIR